MASLNLQENFIQSIIDSLSQSINPDNEKRRAAEQTLTEAKHLAGYASALLKISGDKSLIGKCQVDLNLAASIQFGRLVEDHWKFRDKEHAEKISTQGFDYVILDGQDKQCVRDNILEAVYNQAQNKAIQKQYIRSMKMICVHDYPENLPNFLDKIIEFLNSQDELKVYTGLSGLLALTSRYEFETDEDRNPLFEIINKAFAILGGLVNHLIGHKENQDAQHLLHLICKVFYVSNQLQLSPYLMIQNNLDPWILFFKTILDMPCPQGLQDPTYDTNVIQSRDKSIFWKIKGIAAKITYRLFIKYGNPTIVENNDAVLEFSKKFQKEYSLNLLESHLSILMQKKTLFVGSKALNIAIKFASGSTKQEFTMQHLKPFIEDILQNIIIPILLVTEHDIKTFENDPIEFIRNQYDFTETLFQAKNQVQDLLCYLCKYSSEPKVKTKKGKKPKAQKPDYLHNFLQFVVKNLEQYRVLSQQGADWKIKEALMYAIGTLRDEIDGQKDLKSQMEQMLITYVLPEIASPQPFLRLRACHVYGVFGDLKLNDENHLKQIIEGLFFNMNESQPMPVKFHASCSLEKVLMNNENSIKVVKPQLDFVLKSFLQLMNELDNEELIVSFENIMQVFENEISPYAVEICKYLTKQYIRLIGQDANDDDGESILAAVASITSIGKIINAIQKDLVLLKQVEQIAYPCLLHCLTPDGLDSIEEGIDIINKLIFYGYKQPPLSQEIWRFFPQLLYVCAGNDGDMQGGYGFEFINQIVTVLKNYFAKDPQGTLSVGMNQQKSHLHLTFHFINRCLIVNRNSKNFLDGVSIMSLIISMLENLHGLIDQEFETLLNIVLDEFQFVTSQKKQVKNYKSILIQAISSFFCYNSIMAFELIQKKTNILLIFQEWFILMKDFSNDFELRRIIFGLSSILKTQETHLPQFINQKLPDLIVQLSMLCEKVHSGRVKQLKEDQEYIQKGDQEWDESDEDGSDDNIADGDDDENFEDSEEEWKKQQKMFAKLGPKLESGKSLTKDEIEEFGLDVDDDDENDSDYEFNGGDMDLYESNFDKYDELKFLKDSLIQINNSNPSTYQRIMAGFQSQEEKSKFENIMQECEGLIEQERIVKDQLDALENKQKES